MFANVFDNGEFHGGTRQDGSLHSPHAPSVMKEAQIAQFTPHVLCAKTNGQVSVSLSRYIQVHHTRIQD